MQFENGSVILQWWAALVLGFALIVIIAGMYLCSKETGYWNGVNTRQDVEEKERVIRQNKRCEKERGREKMDFGSTWDNIARSWKKHPLGFVLMIGCVLFVLSFISKHFKTSNE